MKKSILTLVLLLAGQFSFAYSEIPLLIKGRTSGFVPSEYANSFQCKIYTDRKVVNRVINGISYKETNAIKIDVNLIIELLHQSHEAETAGNVKKYPGITDVPTNYYLGLLAESHGDSHEMTLKANGSRYYENQSLEAKRLVNLLDTLCN